MKRYVTPENGEWGQTIHRSPETGAAYGEVFERLNKAMNEPNHPGHGLAKLGARSASLNSSVIKGRLFDTVSVEWHPDQLPTVAEQLPRQARGVRLKVHDVFATAERSTPRAYWLDRRGNQTEFDVAHVPGNIWHAMRVFGREVSPRVKKPGQE